MMARFAIQIVLIGILAFSVGCGEFALDTYWRSGSYRLIAVDARHQMSLIDTSDEAWEGIGPTVFSIGANDKYVVVAQHPSKDYFGRFDRSVTCHFIVERTPSSGPLSARRHFAGR